MEIRNPTSTAAQLSQLTNLSQTPTATLQQNAAQQAKQQQRNDSSSAVVKLSEKAQQLARAEENRNVERRNTERADAARASNAAQQATQPSGIQFMAGTSQSGSIINTYA